MHSGLVSIVKQLKSIRKVRARFMMGWVKEAKNKLMGYEEFFGSPRSLSPPEAKNCGYRGAYRGFYFDDIRYRSKLKKVRVKIESLEADYEEGLAELKDYVT